MNEDKEKISREFIKYVTYMRDKFCDGKEKEVFLSLTTKERELAMKIELRQYTGFERNDNYRQRQFWELFRQFFPQYDKATVAIIRKKCNDYSRYQTMRHAISLGRKVKGNEIYGTAAPIMFQSGTFKELPLKDMDFIPYFSIKTMTKEILQQMRNVQGNLEFRIRGGAGARKPDARDSNRGNSIACCVVTGGKYADKSAGICGSIHINGNLVKKGLKDCTLDTNFLLQCQVFATVSRVIVTLFGSSPWFRATMDKLRDIPDERLIPGRRIPCSHIWWTSDPKSFHVHTDTNTIPPAFVFCVETCLGGELMVTLPSGDVRVIPTTAGVVVGGKWAQFPHCNAPVIDGTRHSFVCYLDNRSISKSWLCRTVDDGFYAYNEVVNKMLLEYGL